MGCGDLGFCSFHAPLSKTGSAREGEEAALIMAFAGLSVSGMNKNLWRISFFPFSELLISEFIELFNISIF